MKSAELGKILCENWAALPQVTIAAIEGVAIGGGALLAQALDWRVMAKSASMYLPEARLGFNLAWGGLPRLVSLVGPARAKRALLTGFTLDAGRAEAWGLADVITEDGRAVDAAMRLAEETLGVPALTRRMTKRAVAAQVDASHFAHADAEQFLLCAWMAERPGKQL
jgi:enoyl-CoA hydratase/3-hydroxyacyl-CoA dehydrogenase